MKELSARSLVVSPIKRGHPRRWRAEVDKKTLWPVWPGILAIASDSVSPAPGIPRLDLLDTASIAAFVMTNAATR